MKALLPVLAIALTCCQTKKQEQQFNNFDSTLKQDQTKVEKDLPDTIKNSGNLSTPEIYANERFRDVSVQRQDSTKFLIKGKAQVFEAAFSWVVEDGHNELKQGHEMTDAGAPAWGNFQFSIDISKKNKYSTLHLILFESSAKDGSRQYELPVKLY